MERRKSVGTAKEREVVEDQMVIEGETINGSDADEAEQIKHGSVKEIKKYLFFNPRLRGDIYEAGDIYDTKPGGQEAAEWEINWCVQKLLVSTLSRVTKNTLIARKDRTSHISNHFLQYGLI